MSRVERVNDLLRRIEDETRTAFDEHAQLLQENAKLFALLKHESEQTEKLRELVRDVWHLFTEHGAVHPYDLPKVDAVRDGLRELGVEVD